MIAYAKTKPGALNYGTFGIGTSGHLNIIHLESETGTKFTPVHYRGAAPAITDLLGGHIQMMIVAIGLLRQNIEAGKLKALASAAGSACRNIPICRRSSESGLPGFEAGSWYGLAAPKGTPREIVDKLSAETQKIFADPAFREKFLGARGDLLDRQPAGAVRRAHARRSRQMGQGHQGRQLEGGIGLGLMVRSDAVRNHGLGSRHPSRCASGAPR